MLLQLLKEIETCFNNDCYWAALSLSLTIPDICGKAEYPNKKTGARYKEWYKKYVSVLYPKPTERCDYDMPYLSSEVVYQLRNSILHQATPNIDVNEIKEEDCKINKFKLIFCKDYLGDTSYVSYNGSPFDKQNIVERGYSVNVYLLCTRMCKAAMKYYSENKEKFDFFNYHIEYQN